MPGGMLPDTIVQVSVLPPLFIRNSSAFCPTLRVGSTHTPFTIVPPLVLGEHSCVSPATASAGPAAARPASIVPATTTVTIAFLMAPPRLLLVRHLWRRRSVGGDCTGNAARSPPPRVQARPRDASDTAMTAAIYPPAPARCWSPTGRSAARGTFTG